MADYAHPEALVETQWLAEHLDDPKVRVVEVDLNPVAYDSGHVPGAAFWNVLTTFVLPDFRTNLDRATAEELMARTGIGNDTTVVVYSNYIALAGWAFWFMKLFGHGDVRVLNGNRKKWLAEGRPLTTEEPALPSAAHYAATDPDPTLRVLLPEVQAALGKPDCVIVDVRGPKEYSGEWFVNKPPEGVERSGHIPGAVHIYWETALLDDGRFRPCGELQALFAEKGVTADKEVLTYCTFGGRSAQTWFVLKHLLGYERIRTYDGSWLEWSRAPELPVEK
jgi:thiosulfate/3-mercaptopyruvate sulfurtransferase